MQGVNDATKQGQEGEGRRRKTRGAVALNSSSLFHPCLSSTLRGEETEMWQENQVHFQNFPLTLTQAILMEIHFMGFLCRFTWLAPEIFQTSEQ